MGTIIYDYIRYDYINIDKEHHSRYDKETAYFFCVIWREREGGGRERKRERERGGRKEGREGGRRREGEIHLLAKS